MKLLFENWRKFINEGSSGELVGLLRDDQSLVYPLEEKDMRRAITKYVGIYADKGLKLKQEEVIYAAQEAGLIEQGDANYYLDVIAKASPMSPEEMADVERVRGPRREPVPRTDPVMWSKSLGGPGDDE